MALAFEAPVKLNDGRYFVKITNEDKTRVFKQINKCKITGPGVYKVPVDLSSYDDIIVNKAAESSEIWFGKVIPDETLKNMYENSITADAFEASLMKVKGKCVTTVFDTDKNEVSVDALEVGKSCNLIVELSGIWFLKKSFGPIWRVVQARIISTSEEKKSGYLFVDEPETQDDPEETLEDFA
jgi:hypothetical protein